VSLSDLRDRLLERGNPISSLLTAALSVAIRQAHADDARVIVLKATGRLPAVGGDIVGAADSPVRLGRLASG
jgi:enoyl-CoA hydratase/carnithine racemase